MTLPELFGAAVRRDGANPFLTYYDDVTGERIELSAVTTANWVAKTANLLADEYDLEPGESVAIGLPPHWLGVVWALSTWSVGASVTTGEGTLAITGPDFAIRGARETVASALLPSADGSASRCRRESTITGPRSTTIPTFSFRTIHLPVAVRRTTRRRTTT